MKKGPSDCGEPLSEGLFSLAGFDLLGSTPRLHTARSTSLLLTRYGLGPGASEFVEATVTTSDPDRPSASNRRQAALRRRPAGHRARE